MIKTLIYYRNSDGYNQCLYIDNEKMEYDEYGTRCIIECKDTIYIKTGLRSLKKAREDLVSMGFKKGYVVGTKK